jgi:predicted N-acetyltransferase YhbS
LRSNQSNLFLADDAAGIGDGFARILISAPRTALFRIPLRQKVRAMTTQAVEIRLQTPDDFPALTQLNEASFGPGRFARTAYRVREGAAAEPRLNLCAVKDDVIIGAVQFAPVTIGGAAGALLLGPLVIEEAHKNQGHGLRLMLEGLRRARELGYRLVILVGDLPYYARAGFVVAPFGQFVMPGPVDSARLLYAELEPGALRAYGGLVRGVPA